MKRCFVFFAGRAERRRQRLKTFGLLVACGVFLGAVSGLYGVMSDRLWQSVSRETQLLPISRVADTGNLVGLSFDVAWGEDQTVEILEVLDIYGIHATFFVTNSWLETYPDLVKEIHARGHELGLHSATHPYFSSLSKDGMKKELKENSRAVASLTGQEGKFFRPPYGDYNNNVLAVAGDLGLVTVSWSVDGGDWQDISARKICKNVLEQTKAGDIVMLQNNNRETVTALKEILNGWQSQGLRPVPLGAMVRLDDYFVDYDGVQKGSGSREQD